MGTGQYERGIQAPQEAIRLNPDDSFAYDVSRITISSLTGSRRPRMPCGGPRNANWKSRIFWSLRYYLAFFNGDQAGMEREIARARGQHGVEDWMCA